MSMQNLMMAGNTLMQMRTMQSAGTRLQGRANVLKSELKTDQKPSEEKKARIEELEGRAQDVIGHIMEKAQKTNEELKKNEEDKVQKEEEKNKTDGVKEEKDTKKTVTDRVEVSKTSQNPVDFVADGRGIAEADSTFDYSYTDVGLQQSAASSHRKVDVMA